MHDIKAVADVLTYLVQAEHTQSRPHQRMFLWHVTPRILTNRLSCPFADQQQPEGERLREGRRKQCIEIGSGIASSLWVE